MVGTRWVWVTRCSSIRASACSGSQAGMWTVVTPHVSGACSPKLYGAVWYSGPVTRWTSPSR